MGVLNYQQLLYCNSKQSALVYGLSIIRQTKYYYTHDAPCRHGESMHASIWGVCLAKAKAVTRSLRSNYVLFVKGFKKIEYKFVYQKNHHRSLIYKYSSLSKLR